MSWLPAMMFMRMLDDDEPDLLQNPPYPVEQYSTGCNAGNTPVVDEIHPPVTDDTPASNSTECTPLPLKRYSSVSVVATKRTRSAPTPIAVTVRPQQ